jgi:hypothetical protein
MGMGSDYLHAGSSVSLAQWAGQDLEQAMSFVFFAKLGFGAEELQDANTAYFEALHSEPATEPRQGPYCLPEVWNHAPVDVEAAHQATQALCRGN